jgi:hypothetical protein
MKKILRLTTILILLLFLGGNAWGQINESFESGLPTSYTSNTSYALSSGTWTGQANGIIRGTTGVNTGSYSCQIRSQTGAQITTPTLIGGVGTISFYVTASTASGGLQIRISEDNGGNWAQVSGSPISFGTTKVFQSFEVNNSSVNKVQFYRTGATVFIDDVSISQAPASGPADPGSFSASAFSSSQINLAATANGAGDIILVAFNTSNSFGNPTGKYSAGNAITGGGTVHYVGAAASLTNHTGLSAGETWYYKAWSVDGSDEYSTGLTDNATTFAAEPSNHPSSFGATANSSSAITVSWTDAVPAANGYLIKGSDVGYGSITNPVDGTPESDGGLVKNVGTGVETHQFTGLAASTTYYFKIYPYNGSAATVNYKTDETIEQATATTEAYVGPNIWVNEIHYDNDGADVNEFIEVVLENPGSYALADFDVYLVNGSGGAIYDTKTLNQFTVGSTYGDFTFYSYTYSVNGIQNGDPDGMAIAYQGNLISGQFLSYEGLITGSGGAVDGVTSVDIGVSEGGSTPVGYSLQLAGAGTVYSDFVWMAPATNTQGLINNQQSFYAATVWNGSTDTDWNTAGNWSNGIPVLASEVTIPAASNLPVLSASGSAGNLTIETSGGLTIQMNGALTVSGTFTNNAGAAALVLKSDASGTGSLIHSTTGVNATMQRYMNNADWSNWQDGWHFLSSPVTSQAIDPAFTADPYDFFLWNEPSNEWINYKNQSGGGGSAPYFDVVNSSNNFAMGRGYMAAYDADDTKSFTGQLNVADVSVAGLTITSGLNKSWHLLGNPFSSALTWDASVDWGLTNIAGVAKIWNEANQSYSDLTSSPSTVIPATNGFMVQVSSGTGSLTLPSAKRAHDAQAFYKSTVSGLMLTAKSHEAGNAQESRIIVNPDATTGFDLMLDGEFLAGYGPVFYSVAGDLKLSTNSLPQISADTEIPFNFIKNEGTQFSITASGFEGLSATPYLIDLKTGSSQNLIDQPFYNFTAAEGDVPNRFLLKFGAVGIDDNIATEQTSIYSHGRLVYISSTKSANALINIYNITGQQVYANTMVIDGQKQIALNTPTGWYIVKVRTQQGVATQKVFIKSNQ